MLVTHLSCLLSYLVLWLFLFNGSTGLNKESRYVYDDYKQKVSGVLSACSVPLVLFGMTSVRQMYLVHQMFLVQQMSPVWPTL